MIAYHEANPQSVNDVLKDGLKCSSRGDLSDDQVRQQTDQLLDQHRPAGLITASLSRNDNLYAFLFTGDKLIGIDKGEALTLQEYLATTDQAVFELHIDPDRTYVSDLDAYDTVAGLIKQKADEQEVQNAAQAYWSRCTKLATYEPGSIDRPELMVTYDVSPEDIRLVQS